MAIIEICVIDPTIAEKITANGTYSELKQSALENGMIPLREYGWKKVSEGHTTIEEVLSNVDH